MTTKAKSDREMHERELDLRKESLELERKRLELQEKRDMEQSEERRLFLQFIMRK